MGHGPGILLSQPCIEKTGYEADDKGKAQAGQYPCNNQSPTEQGDLKHDEAVNAEKGPGGDIGGDRGNTCTTFKKCRNNGKLDEGTSRCN